MGFYNLIILFSLSISSTWSETNTEISNTKDNDLCSLACEVDHNREIPKCNGSKLVPSYHEVCGCLLHYQCCPAKCPNTTILCVNGKEREEHFKDNCGCPVKKCVLCQEMDILCGKCQMLKQSKDALTGCINSVCTPICIDAQKTFCPHCYHLETAFDSNCNCSTGHCIPKPCPEEEEIMQQDCMLIETHIDSCGCKTNRYEAATYCNEANNRAQNTTCSSLCHKKEVVKDKCGCDQAHCVLKPATEELCTHNLENGSSCPSGSYLVPGFSPCGNVRHTCLACPDSREDDSTCNPKCHLLKMSKDVATGCGITECVRKKCVATKIPRCRSAVDLVVEEDECGCLTIHCKKLQKMDEDAFSFHSNLLNWTEAQNFCESRNGHLAVIPDSTNQGIVKKAIGQFDHWVGARCRKYSAYSSFYWIFPNGTRLPFLQPQVRGGWWRRGGGETCDGREAGMAFSANGFDDETLEKRKPFVCQYL